MKTQNRLATDEGGFVMITAIILLVLAVVVIVLVYLFPWYTIGALLCVGAIWLLFQGTMDSKISVVMLIAGIAFICMGVFL
jgi:hypothetical protein